MTLNQGYSDCCGAEVDTPDSNGHGRCSDCKEHCTTVYESDEEDEFESLEEKLEKVIKL